MKLANRQRIEELEKVCKPDKKRPSYALVIYDGDIHDQIETLEVDADLGVWLADNGRGDLGEEIPKGGFKVFFD